MTVSLQSAGASTFRALPWRWWPSCCATRRLPAEALDEVKRQTLAAIEQQRKEPEAVLANALARHGNPYPRGDVRHARSFDEIVAGRECGDAGTQVQAFHQRFYGAAATPSSRRWATSMWQPSGRRCAAGFADWDDRRNLHAGAAAAGGAGAGARLMLDHARQAERDLDGRCSWPCR